MKSQLELKPHEAQIAEIPLQRPPETHGLGGWTFIATVHTTKPSCLSNIEVNIVHWKTKDCMNHAEVKS